MKPRILFLLLIFSGACNHDLLDLNPLDSISDGSVWQDPKLVEHYVLARYNELPHGFPQWAGGLRLTALTDESYHMHEGPRFTNKYTEGKVTPSNMYLFGGFWSEAYVAIRNHNVFLESIKEEVGDPTRMKQLTAEIRFLRCWFYTELFSRYGAVPLIKSTFAIEGNFESDRTPVSDIVAFIEEELDLAIADLPVTQTGADFGRVTKGAAIALKARALLYGASPLFSDEDPAKWQKVADACEELFDLGVYSLSSDYRGLFLNVSDPEIIFFKQFISSMPWEPGNGIPGSGTYYHPTGGHTIEQWRMSNGFGGWVSENPLQNLVDKYETVDGELPVTGYTGANDDLQPVLNPNATSYDPNQPYVNRDPRLSYSVVVDGDIIQDREIQFWDCGNDSRCENVDGWWNGALLDYGIKKSLDLSWNSATAGNLNSSTPWMYMRLSEFYLTYAEANYHLGNSGVAIDYVNRVRSRAGVGMPPIESSQTGSDLLQKIKHERDIELAFEGNRWYDARRWKDAAVDFAKNAVGLEVTKDSLTGVKSYRYFVEQQRSFPESHYLFPIPFEEMNKTTWTQNSGY